MAKTTPQPTGLVAIAFGANYYHNLAGTQRTELPHIVPSYENDDEDDDDDNGDEEIVEEVEGQSVEGEGIEDVDPDDKDLHQLEDQLLKQSLNDNSEEPPQEKEKEETPPAPTDDKEEDMQAKDQENVSTTADDQDSQEKKEGDEAVEIHTTKEAITTTIKASMFAESGPTRSPWDMDDDPIRQLACSSAATIVLTENGKIYSMGTIHGYVRSSPTRTIIQLPLKCVQIAAGRHFCLARMEGGLAVCSWGAGHFGQLGHGDAAPCSDHPTVMEGLLPHHVGSPIGSIAAGYWHGMAVTEQGQVWSWGCNRNQQCGRKRERDANSPNGSSSNVPPTILVPQLVPFPRSNSNSNTTASGGELKILKIAGGRSHSVALCDKGNVYCWGACSYGQCSGPSDVSLGSLRRKSGLAPPRLVEALSKVCIVDVAAGDTHTMALTGGGRVFAWGGSSEGQLGLGHCNSMNVKPKLVSDLDFVAIEAGQEQRRQKEQEKTEQPQQPTLTQRLALAKKRLSDTVTMATTPENEVTATTTGEDTKATTPTTTATTTAGLVATTAVKAQHMLSHVPKVVSIHAAGNYSVATSSSGHVYTWGCNDVGNLGLPIIRPVRDPNAVEGQEKVDEGQVLPLPLVEPNEPVSRAQQLAAGTTSNGGANSLRHFHTQSFDSSHNIALPQRIDCLGDYHVTDCAAGGTFLWCLGYPRSDTSNMEVLAHSIAAGNILPKNTGSSITNPKPYTMTTRVGRTLLELNEFRRQKALMAANKVNDIATATKAVARTSRKSLSKTIATPLETTTTASTPTTMSETPEFPSMGAIESAALSPASSAASDQNKELEVVATQPPRGVDEEYDNSQDESCSSTGVYEPSPVASQKKSIRQRFGPMQLMRKLSNRGGLSANNNGASPSNGSTGGGSSRSFLRSSSKASSEGGQTDTTSGNERRGRKFF
jgi:alpha-tubulin suppressor-like RCC1 family protein